MITGTSLGAGLATLAAADLINTYKLTASSLIVHTFGSPRVGNDIFANYVNKRVTIYRINNINDPVPHIPTR